MLLQVLIFAIHSINNLAISQIKPLGNLVLKAEFVPNIVNSISQLNIQVTPQHQIPYNGKLRVKIKKFWSQFLEKKNISTIQNNTTCYNNINTSINLSCKIYSSDDQNFTIIVNNIFDIDHDPNISFSITINNVLTPPTVLTSLDQFTIETIDAYQNAIDKNQVQLQKLNATQMNTNFISTNITVGTIINQLNLTIKFQQIIIPSDTIQFKFPQNIIYEKKNVKLRDQKNMMNFSIPDFKNAQKIITFTIERISQGNQIIQNQTIPMHLSINFTIPWTTQSNQITITFKRSGAQYLIGTGTLTPLINKLAVQLQTETTCEDLNCKNCSLSDDCVQCQQGFLLAKDGICYIQCPESYPVLQDNQCVECPSNCSQCDSKGNCLQQGISLYFFQGKCVTQCPQNYQISADKDNCQFINQKDSLKTFIKILFPFLIATLICLASIFVSKLKASQTIVSAAIVGIVSIVELSSWLFLLIIYSQRKTQLNKQMILLIIGISFLFLINLVHFVFYFKYYRKDETFKDWKQKKWNRVSNCIILILSFFTFKAYYLIYSRYFGFETFSATWKKINLFFPLDVLAIISIFLNSVIMIIGASLILIQQNRKNYFSQAFVSSLQVIIISAIMIIFFIFNCKKNDKIFKDRENKYTQQQTPNNLDEFSAKQNYMQMTFDINKNQKNNVCNLQTIRKSKEQQKSETFNNIDQQLLNKNEYQVVLNLNKLENKQPTLKRKNQVQNIQHSNLSEDNKKKTKQQLKIQEIKSQIKNLNQILNPDIYKQKHIQLNNDDSSSLQNQKIKDQQKEIKIQQIPIKVNDNQMSQQYQYQQQNSNYKLKQSIISSENQQSHNGNQINHNQNNKKQIFEQIDTKEGEISKQTHKQ